MKHAIVSDMVVLVCYLLAASPAVTGLSVHEWVGLAAGCFLMLHGISAFKRSRSGRLYRLRVFVDILLALSLTVCLISGIAISGSVLPAAGYFVPDGFFFWGPLHSTSAKFLLGLLLLHCVLQASWLSLLRSKLLS